MIDDADSIRTIRAIDEMNALCRAEWERRRLMGFLYPDYRGIDGPLLDAMRTGKLRLAKHFLNAIRARKDRRKAWPENVCMFRKVQAT